MVEAFAIVAVVLFSLVMLCFLALGIIRIIDDIQDIQRKKLEWKREDMIRGWSEDMLRRYRRKDDATHD